MSTKTFADFGIDVPMAATGEVDVTCPQCSASRKKKGVKCLSVNAEKRVWNCAHCGWSGGLGDGETHRPVIAKTYRKPDYVANSTALPDEVVAWFASRAITQSVLKRNLIGAGSVYFPQVEEHRGCVKFPYLRGAAVVNVKYRTRDKLFRMESGAERVLYGLNDIAPQLVWVEGEMDKLSVEVAGFTSCVSVPDGAPTPNSRNYASKFDFLDATELERATTHVIAVDNDEPGARLQDELVRRLGPERCLIVTWPEHCKDANDVLVQHGPNTLRECIEAAAPVPVEGEHAVSEFVEAMDRLYRYGMPKGVSTGWPSLDRYYTVLAGEWTLVTGIPNHGKSEFTDALMVQLMQLHGWRFAVFSPENQPTAMHLARLAEKYIGKPFEGPEGARMTVGEKDRALTFLDQHVTVLLPEEPTVDALIDRLRTIVMRRGVQGAVLDPWNEIEHVRPGGMTETEYISTSLTKLRKFARAHGVHLWIVAHPTKLEKDKNGNYPVPTPYDVAGSAHWRNKADNCLCVWRDLGKNGDVTAIHVQKVRKKSVGRVGKVELRYARSVGTYHEPDQRDAYERASNGA